MRRLSRAGVLERKILPYLGYYPWECSICRAKTYFRDEGQRRRSRTSSFLAQ
jgi:hypothetical protein